MRSVSDMPARLLHFLCGDAAAFERLRAQTTEYRHRRVSAAKYARAFVRALAADGAHAHVVDGFAAAIRDAELRAEFVREYVCAVVDAVSRALCLL